MVTDAVRDGSECVEAAAVLLELGGWGWRNGELLPGQGPRELNPVSRAPDACLSRDNLRIDLFYVITSIMRNYVFLPH